MVYRLGILNSQIVFLPILDDKYSRNVSRATSKDEMNVDLTPKKQKDFCTYCEILIVC